MHILFLADATSVHSYRWIKYFSEIDDISITWCSFNENTMPVLDNVEYKVIRKSSPAQLLSAYKFIKNKSPDLIHAHYLGWNGFFSLLFPKISLVLTAWGSDIVFNSANILKRIFIKQMLKRAQIITCDAYHLSDRMISLGASKDQIKLIMFGIDDSQFVESRAPFGGGADETDCVVGSIRNLHPVYDVITFVKAAEVVAAQRDDIKFMIAGDGPERAMLEQYVVESGLGPFIEFCGRLESSELNNFYNTIDVYVSTALSDGGIASSTAEAMLCGRPVIITDNAENKFWVEDGKNGHIFECSDHAGLAQKILDCINNKNDAVKLGRSALKIAS